MIEILLYASAFVLVIATIVGYIDFFTNTELGCLGLIFFKLFYLGYLFGSDKKYNFQKFVQISSTISIVVLVFSNISNQ